MHSEKFILLFVRKLWPLALQFPFSAGDRHPLARPQSNKVSLKFSEGGQDVEEHLAHRVAWIVAAMTECERDATSGELIGNRSCVWNGAGEPIQFWYNQRIAFANSGEGLIQSWSGPVRSGQSVIDVNAVRSYA